MKISSMKFYYVFVLFFTASLYSACGNTYDREQANPETLDEPLSASSQCWKLTLKNDAITTEKGLDCELVNENKVELMTCDINEGEAILVVCCKKGSDGKCLDGKDTFRIRVTETKENGEETTVHEEKRIIRCIRR